MKNLIICRHAKSSWDDPYMDDHQRPLAPRGLRDAPRMAQRLKIRGISPDYFVSSDAERAKATAFITAENLHFPKERVVLTSQLYHASASTILKAIQGTPEGNKTVLVFGHNPGFNDLIVHLGGQIDNLPTCGQFAFRFDVDAWKEIDTKNATEWFLDYPKKQ
ncbi:SixA phosphatase family protein [Echinicola vietnamensis]|uniref:Phosphohistidine phosphatase SixA n=1 Tax=Echinicola vietnamensis (strain DSM 17526 / LMG 23754 / KMM 6221) TaxID=926556 RepID=L0G3L9_ECHVK|nr:histidine phosphatase family protein [Echinicola vietnamensis]AGA80834.1 phosphohistidine phosphatase SixA [Echinicola vietnamensis DSM 17526]